ncbi:cysteine proteinase [Thozetella sp. PMI_491]|nr:cysteine proteinase [Thozetella sp. PMI_491]
MSMIESVLGNGGRRGRRPIPDGPMPLPDPRRRGAVKDPQGKLDEFWRTFKAGAPGQVTNVIPKKSHAGRAIERSAKKAVVNSPNPGVGVSAPSHASYETARAACVAKVDKIVKECRRINQKYRDPHFDLEVDLKKHKRFCLESLDNRAAPPREVIIERRRDDRRRDDRTESSEDEGPPSPPPGPPLPNFREREAVPGARFKPLSVKRVSEIFDDPQFFIEGATAADVRQGRDGDCWLMAALCTMSNKPGLIDKVCVARDEAVGVYGFVFYRDGEWFSEIIDDKLYLIKADYDDINPERLAWEDLDRTNSDEAYRKTYQSNSNALYFAQCANPNETWLPLLEKAYAKAHGDYAAIDGGHMGEGIEDLTGGIASEVFTTDILDKEYFWKEELMKVNDQFLFGCSTGMWGSGWGIRTGIMEGHAYSVMRAVEMDGERLVLLKNPWGKGEWRGAWSDGSKEWTAEWLQKLNHRFGDDGAFWISYHDLLRKYSVFDRTRLFSPEWKLATSWTSMDVPWMLEYHDTKFSFTLSRPGPVVIVLSQLDSRYFRGLEGKYRFKLSFRVHKAGEDDYIVRSQASYYMSRSANVELNLEAGEYHVLVRIDALRRDGILPAEDVVKRHASLYREKLIRIGLSYDSAHAKGRIIETEEEKAAREAHQKYRREKYRKSFVKRVRKSRERHHRDMVRNREKRAKRMARKREKELEAFQKREKEMQEEEEKMRAEDARAPSMERARFGQGYGPDGPSELTESFSTAQEGEDGPQPFGEGANPPTTTLPAHFRNGGERGLDEGPDPRPPTDTFPDMQPGPGVTTMSDISEREIEHRMEQYDEMRKGEESIGSPPPPPPPIPGYFDPGSREFDSWNAVAIVGLRVYYKTAEDDQDTEVLKLRVVRPSPYSQSDDEEEDDDKADEKDRDDEASMLDVDDAAKDATQNGEHVVLAEQEAMAMEP